jgi:hypothetical protein
MTVHLLDDHPRIGVPVLLALRPAPGIIGPVEDGRIALRAFDPDLATLMPPGAFV